MQTTAKQYATAQAVLAKSAAEQKFMKKLQT